MNGLPTWSSRVRLSALSGLAIAGLAAAIAAGATMAVPTPAKARVFVGFGFGFPGYYPAPYYYPPAYFAPPPYYYPPVPAYYPPPAYSQPAYQQPASPTPVISYSHRPAFYRNGVLCREFTSTTITAGRTAQTYGTACRDPSGQWRVAN